jgi:hypothetical protein
MENILVPPGTPADRMVEIIRPRYRNRTLGHHRFACRRVCGNGDAYATVVGTAGQEGLKQEIKKSGIPA